MKISNNERGMSLVSVMVAIGLTGVLATIIMGLSEQQSKLQKKATIDAELGAALNHMQTILTNKESCNATLMGTKKGEEITILSNKSLADETKEPFAIVSADTPFRGTKVYWTGMRILTKEEIKEKFKREEEDGVVVVEVEFYRQKAGEENSPNRTLGGNRFIKHYDVQVVYGSEEQITDNLSAEFVIEECHSKSSQSFIKSISTYDKAIPESDGVIGGGGSAYIGFCVTPDEGGKTSPESSILQCLTGK